VVLSPGIYRETIHLKSEVDLIAQKAHLSTIEGGVVASGVTSARVEGLLIRADDVGISANDSNVSIARCEISGARTAGVQFTGTSLGSLSASSIHDNPGSGVTVAGHSSPDIENNLIVGNGGQPANLRPGLELLSTDKPHVTGNVFLSNGADAIWVNSQDPALVERNYFSVAGKTDKRGPSPVKVVGDKP